MKVAIASDHRGFALKEYIIAAPDLSLIDWIDCGTYAPGQVDYVEYGVSALSYIKEKKAERAVLLCASGVGMAIVANRYDFVYGAVAWNTAVAAMSRADDNCNVLILPADFIVPRDVTEIISVWIHTPCKGGVYQERLKKINRLVRS